MSQSVLQYLSAVHIFWPGCAAEIFMSLVLLSAIIAHACFLFKAYQRRNSLLWLRHLHGLVSGNPFEHNQKGLSPSCALDPAKLANISVFICPRHNAWPLWVGGLLLTCADKILKANYMSIETWDFSDAYCNYNVFPDIKWFFFNALAIQSICINSPFLKGFFLYCHKFKCISFFWLQQFSFAHSCMDY